MRLNELEAIARGLASDKERGLPLLEHEKTRDRLTRSRMKDLGTHLRSLTAALGRPSTEAVDVAELTDELLAKVEAYLIKQGKKPGVVNSTVGAKIPRPRRAAVGQHSRAAA